jgi:very-short-patch-repair endonuclease
MMTPKDFAVRTNSPPLQGRGRGWGLTANQLSELKDRAAHMRRNPTEPEKRLWDVLSGSQLGGCEFRRQEVIGWFIADFACPSRSLIVEVDGDTHDAAKDRLRDDILGERGFRVLRVTNRDVMSNLDEVGEAILGALSEGSVRATTPHPNPSPEGEGLKKAQKLLGISLEGSVG